MGCWNDIKKELVQESFDSLRPGGWLETQEIASLVECDDGSLPPDSSLSRWIQQVNAASSILGRPREVSSQQMVQWYKEVGFVDVELVPFRLPIGYGPNDRPNTLAIKDLGLLWRMVMLQSLDTLSLRLFHDILGWSDVEIRV